MNKIDVYIITLAALAVGFVAADMWLIAHRFEQFNAALSTAFVGALVGEAVCLLVKTIKAGKSTDDIEPPDSGVKGG